MKTESTRARYTVAGILLAVGIVLLQFQTLTSRVIGVAIIVIGTLMIFDNELVERLLVFGEVDKSESAKSEADKE